MNKRESEQDETPPPATELQTPLAESREESTDAGLTFTKSEETEQTGIRPRKRRKDAGVTRGPRGPRSQAASGGRTPEQIKADKAVLATALAGAFQGLGVMFGPHWALQTKEQVEQPEGPIDQAATLAEVWDPVLDRYALADMEKFRDAMMWVGAITVTVAITKPRIEVTVAQGKGIVGWIKRKISARRANGTAKK